MPTPHITVPDQTPLVELAVTSSEDTFAFSFTYFDETDLRVTVDGVELAQSEFTVVGDTGYEGGYPSGTVTLDVAVANCTVLIWSEMPPQRINDFVEGGGLPARAANTELDRLTARMRDMRLRLQRTPTLAYAADHTLALTEAGQVFTNTNAAGTFSYTLPQASAGLVYEFAVTAAHAFQILAHAGDAIYDATVSGTTLSASALGCVVRLIGIDPDTWLVESRNGTWTLA